VIDRPVCLIANPSAGGGRTARLLPAVEAALRGHGIGFRVERTHSIEHARELGRETAARGEIAAAMGGDGLLGALAGELRIATQAVLRGAELIGLSRDRTFPMPDGAWPGTGAILAAVETASGHKADAIVGKPEPTMYEAARDRLGEGRALAIGDRLDVDVLGAKRAGLDSALVLTGATAREQVDGAKPAPTHVADSLAALLLT
jgi:glycerol-1-phosphatase